MNEIVRNYQNFSTPAKTKYELLSRIANLYRLLLTINSNVNSGQKWEIRFFWPKNHLLFEIKLPLKARDNFTNLFDSHFETTIIVEKKNK